jgi:hypothetical protein
MVFCFESERHWLKRGNAESHKKDISGNSKNIEESIEIEK